MEAFEIIRVTMNEFDNTPDDTIQAFLSLSEPLISRKRFGKLYPQALAYMAAHRMKMRGFGESAGFGAIAIGDTVGIASVSEGETSVSFSHGQSGSADADSELSMTTYGLQYLQLRNRCIMTIVSAGESYGC